jgi:hypothetical protein
MAFKTHPHDAAGWALVVSTLRDKGITFPHAHIARTLKVSRQTVRLWKAVPLLYVVDVSDLSGIPRRKILPHTLKKMQELLG